MNFGSSLLDFIGKTPLLSPQNFISMHGISANLFFKLEFFNPLSSVKDRIAVAMIEAGEKQGKITPQTVLIEPTSGNTGIALASACAVKGYQLILTMPESMSMERRTLLSAFGAKVILTDPTKGMAGAIEKAKQLEKELPDAYILGQFENRANVEIHKKTTAQEILSDLDGAIDIFLAGVGSGGTLEGVAEGLKEQNLNIKIIAVEPFGSPFLSQGRAGYHKLQGLGAGFCPPILDLSLIDEIITVKDHDAYQTCRELARQEGMLAGISSGAAAFAAAAVAKRPENRGKTIVTILPDTGERYLSTGLFSEGRDLE